MLSLSRLWHSATKPAFHPLTIKRSPKWRAVEQAHLRREPDCRVCRTMHKLQVHHVVPVHVDPSRELDDTNLITLCEPHHLLFGHLMLWRSWNAYVRLDAPAWRAKIDARPLK